MHRLFVIVVCLFVVGMVATSHAGAEVQSRKITYKDGDTTLIGHLYYDDEVSGERPGVLVVHEWWGLNNYARTRARMLAEMGYVAFALDMYGQGKSTTERHTAQEWATAHYKDLTMMRRRAALGLNVLRSESLVDKKRIAAIGYCFGGSTVLQLAYAGADIAGVVSFHGNTLPPSETDAQRIKTRVLVCHGAADPFVPQERLQSFVDAVSAAKVDFHVVQYGGAVHSFTNPGAGDDKGSGSAYDAKADQRSWRHMQGFFDELFDN